MSTDRTGESEGLPARRRTLVMLSVICGVLLMSLDGAIANIALPTIARDLQVSDAATVWVVNAYNVGSVICLLPAAALGEIFGLKRVYALGLILFTLSSLACALAPSLLVLTRPCHQPELSDAAARLADDLTGSVRLRILDQPRRT